MTDKILEGDFSWEMLGNINKGRENLGQDMPVVVYRLFQYTMRSILTKSYGSKEMIHIFRESGRLAGKEFAKNLLDLSLDLDLFISKLQTTLKELKIGILRIESFDLESGKALLTVSEDLDCSGLPVTGECICNYDEGFIAGIFSEYTKNLYFAVEIDCWSKGDRVCRFKAYPANKET